MRLLIYLPIFTLFFITSCFSQNGKNPRTDNEVIPQRVFNPLGFSNCKPTNSLMIYPKPDSASKVAEYLREIIQDKNGNLWFGTLGRGVARYDGESLKYFSKEEGLVGTQINGIAEDINGNIWFATTEGLSKYDGNSFINYTTENGLIGDKLWSILADSKGNIWVGSLKGITKYDGKSFAHFPIPKVDVEILAPIFSPDLVWSIIEDSKGNIWFGRDGFGACKYDGKNFTHFTKKDGLNTNVIADIFEDSKGNFWFGARESRVAHKEKPHHFVSSGDGGVSRFDGNSFTKFPEIEELISRDAGPIYEDKLGNIWVSSKNRALYKYDGEKFTNYMEKQGIAPFNCVQSILEDDKGNFWVGFSGGLFLFENEDFRHIGKAYFEE